MIEPIDFGVVNDITTNVPSFNECRSTINVEFIPNRPETWINLKKNIHDIFDDPDGYVLCSVNDIVKAQDEILKLQAKVNMLESQLSDTEKDLDAIVKNAKFWHDREKEVEEELEDLKKENQTLKAKAVINSVYGLTSAELECVKSENSELKKDLKAANKQLDKMDADIDELKNKNRDLEKELAESKTFAEVRYEWHPDCFTVIYTKCDGTKETVGMDLADDTDKKCTMGAFVCHSFNIPQCKKCKNHRYFANTGGHYCHLPDSKYMIPGMFHVNPLTEEDAEGPACEKFEARE